MQLQSSHNLCFLFEVELEEFLHSGSHIMHAVVQQELSNTKDGISFINGYFITATINDTPPH